MSKGPRIDWVTAWKLALRIQAALDPYCERIEIAGSLRRKEPDCGDIELVVIPRRAATMFTEIPGASLLDPALDGMVRAGKLVRANKGIVHKKFHLPALIERGYSNFMLEIIVSSPERWPVELAIKTGPANFSQGLVTPRNRGGRLPSGCRIDDGWLVWRDTEQLSFANEAAFIEFCCERWVPPEERAGF